MAGQGLPGRGQDVVGAGCFRSARGGVVDYDRVMGMCRTCVRGFLGGENGLDRGAACAGRKDRRPMCGMSTHVDSGA